jgi:hypothetical protein
MPTLKLLTAPSHPDGSHQIGSPGGYEFWHFHAEDPSHRLRLSIAFYDGFTLHPEYASRYAAYRRNPTRNAPPTPSQYPFLQANIFENEKSLASSTAYFPAGSFHAEDGPSIALGSSRAIFRENEIALAISEAHQAIAAELTFEPIFALTAPIEKAFTTDKNGTADHFWIPARPLCNVHGQIRIDDRTILFTGLGQHNHYYGLAPYSTVAARWIRGCVLLPRAAELFQAAGDRAIAITAGESGIHSVDNPPFTAEWKPRMISRPSHPTTISVGDRLILRNPRIAALSSKQMQIVYDAYVEGEQATAWVEIDRG